jgi:hypothetical protein
LHRPDVTETSTFIDRIHIVIKWLTFQVLQQNAKPGQMTNVSVLAILRPKHRVMVTRCAEYSMIGRLRRIDVMYSLFRDEEGRRYVWTGCQYLLATVRADNHSEKPFGSQELHAIVYPSPRGFGKGYHRT